MCRYCYGARTSGRGAPGGERHRASPIHRRRLVSLRGRRCFATLWSQRWHRPRFAASALPEKSGEKPFSPRNSKSAFRVRPLRWTKRSSKETVCTRGWRCAMPSCHVKRFHIPLKDASPAWPPLWFQGSRAVPVSRNDRIRNINVGRCINDPWSPHAAHARTHARKVAKILQNAKLAAYRH